jgi:hypothetical protein
MVSESIIVFEIGQDDQEIAETTTCCKTTQSALRVVT